MPEASGRIFDLAERVPVQCWTVGRGGRPASEYLWVEEVVTDVTPTRA